MKLAMQVENEDRRRQGMIEKNSQAETIANQKAEQQAARKVGYINELKVEVGQLEQKYYALTKAQLADVNVGTKVLNDLTNKRAELSKLQQAYGNFSGNVGNYSSATKMLGINLGQVMKEMPNFAISARIGIMSLTNNLPMLAESMKAVRDEQKAMTLAQKEMTAAQIAALPNMGKIPSMFKMITSSIFGLTGVMSILMVLFQIFGADIIKFVGNLFKADTQIRKTTASIYDLNTSQQVLNETMEKGGGVYGDAVKSIEEMSVQLKAAKGNHDEEIIALDKYNKGLGENLGKATSVGQALDLIASKKDAYVDAMLKMAYANAFLAKSSDDIVKQVDVMTKSNAEIVGEQSKFYIDKINEWVENIKSLQKAGIPTDESERQLALWSKRYNDFSEKERSKQLSDINKHQQNMSGQYEKYYNEYLTGLENAGIKSGIINTKTDDERLKKQKELHAKMLEREYELNLKTKKQLEELSESIKKSLSKLISTPTSSQEFFNNEADRRLKQAEENRKLFVENEKNRLADELEISQGNIDATLEAKRNMLNSQMQIELDVAQLTAEQKLAIELKYAQYNKDINAEAFTSKLDMAAQVTNGLMNLLGKESKAGKLAAAASIGVQTAKDAYTTGAAAIKYFVGAPPLIPPNPFLGAMAAVQTGVIIANGAKSIADIYAVKEPSSSDVGSGNVTSTTVTEKFHTGREGTANSTEKEKEINATLLRGEAVLSNRNTDVFNSLLSGIKSYGGSDSITSNVGLNSGNNADMIASIVKTVLDNQKPPIVVWKDKEDFESKMVQFTQNTHL